jgi:hypothetical protein
MYWDSKFRKRKKKKVVTALRLMTKLIGLSQPAKLSRTEQLKKLGNDYFLPRHLNHNRESSYAEGTCQTVLQPGATRESGALSHLSLPSGNKVASARL